MNAILRNCCVSALLVACVGMGSAAAANPPPGKAALPPPPGLNDPGVGAGVQQPDTAAPAPAAAEPAAEDPLAPLSKPDARLVRDKASRDVSTNAQRIAGSQVTRRTQGSDTVEEYRENGHVWMIKIVPQSGPTQTFTDPDGSGRLARNPNEGPVSPVYYTLYEWK